MVLDYSDIDTILERATSELVTKKEFDERIDELMNLIDTAHEHLLAHSSLSRNINRPDTNATRLTTY